MRNFFIALSSVYIFVGNCKLYKRKLLLYIKIKIIIQSICIAKDGEFMIVKIKLGHFNGM
jgi:hypothetical protein